MEMARLNPRLSGWVAVLLASFDITPLPLWVPGVWKTSCAIWWFRLALASDTAYATARLAGVTDDKDIKILIDSASLIKAHQDIWNRIGELTVRLT
jgi:hypothetical protein